MSDEKTVQWFVMRDLKRANSREHAYEQLQGKNLTVFTPKIWKIIVRQGKRVRLQVPCIPNLLFVYATREQLDPIVEKIPTLQYYYQRHAWCTPMIVPDVEMNRFIHAVEATDTCRFYLPSEITPRMKNRRIRIIGGPFDEYEGTLITTRGSKVKRLLVEIPGLLAVSVEVNPEYIQLCE